MLQTNTKIRQLSDITISRIAAGEVIERPSSVIKELVENSIDAGATKIDIFVERAGKNLIVISDNGHGMSKDDLELAVQRHTTSKLDEKDIMDIQSFGFRGEALPSIGSISRMTISTYDQNSKSAWQIYIEGGVVNSSAQSNHNIGTKIEVSDLFFATPARLKFLRSDRVEFATCLDVVKKIAMAHPHISFSLLHDGKNILKLKASESQQRITEILGQDFLDNSTIADLSHPEIKVKGLVSLPTYNRAAALDQFLFINNRPVKDKVLATAVKVAYQDFLARDRHPVLVLFVEIDPHLIDVNVHPAKSEVRFHDANMVRGLMISAIKDAINITGHRVSTTNAQNAIEYFMPSGNESYARDIEARNFRPAGESYSQKPQQQAIYPSTRYNAPLMPLMKSEDQSQSTIYKDNDEYPLGAASAQLHKTYIISQTKNSIIITDQHAAHERLTYEKLKKQLEHDGLITQRLLIPEIIELPDQQRADVMRGRQEQLAKLGLVFQHFGDQSIIVTEVPSLIKDVNISELIKDLADNLLDMGENISLIEIIEHITETYACHHSIRAGRVLNINEMNSLLRQMEETPFSGQCNHGRPTYIELQLKDIEKLFGRR